jgi:predicted AlkP superfamily phosphohydrolase/phosphomutase
MKKFIPVIIALVALVLLISAYKTFHKPTLRLYWFIPDGVRAEPGLFNVYKWAEEGKLPNIKKLMDRGSYGYAYPNFPSHTPTNFATLLTGAYPSVNGVNDGPMHVIGKPLDKVAIAGFRSVAKKVAPIWKTLEDAGLKVALLSIPGSTPPEIQKGEVYRGRWGGWGADFAALNFETKGNLAQRVKQGRGARFFYFGPQLTQYFDSVTPSGWENPPKSYSPAMEIALNGWGATTYAYLYDSTDDGKVNYDHVAFSSDKKSILASVAPGKWSDWVPITLKWTSEDKTIDVPTKVKIAVIKLGEADGFYRIRFFYENMNKYIAFPDNASDQIETLAGPMVDFSDNFPPQLVYYPEDKQIFLDESNMSMEWHKNAVKPVINNGKPNVVIQDVYTPNQMLTSRWWMGYVDPESTRYNDVTDAEREKLWTEVQDMYKKIDDVVGEILANSDSNTYIVFSSDHGNIPLNRSVNLNNLFARKGWLKFQIDPKTGEPIIDWKNSSVIYLKMAHVYINPAGLSGDYTRASGPAYETLRNEVIAALTDLTDVNGKKPLTKVVKWEDVKKDLQLDPDRAGDLVIANAPGYGWNEEMSNDLSLFSTPLITGYKQAIMASEVPGMWTPFIIAGPGIKAKNFLGDKPFELIHEYPTIMKALKVAIPDFVQGKALDVFQ